MPINPGVLPTNTQGMHPCTPVLSQSLHYTCKNQYTANKFNVIQYYTSVCGYMPISPGVPGTFVVGFHAHCSRLPGCAGCTSSATCSTLWDAGDGLAPQTGWGPLHVQSQARALPEWMLGHSHSTAHDGVHWDTAWSASQCGQFTHSSTPCKEWSTRTLEPRKCTHMVAHRTETNEPKPLLTWIQWSCAELTRWPFPSLYVCVSSIPYIGKFLKILRIHCHSQKYFPHFFLNYIILFLYIWGTKLHMQFFPANFKTFTKIFSRKHFLLYL